MTYTVPQSVPGAAQQQQQVAPAPSNTQMAQAMEMMYEKMRTQEQELLRIKQEKEEERIKKEQEAKAWAPPTQSQVNAFFGRAAPSGSEAVGAGVPRAGIKLEPKGEPVVKQEVNSSPPASGDVVAWMQYLQNSGLMEVPGASSAAVPPNLGAVGGAGSCAGAAPHPAPPPQLGAESAMEMMKRFMEMLKPEASSSSGGGATEFPRLQRDKDALRRSLQRRGGGELSP